MAPVFPAGTLTYLLTDIEASSELWERDPEVMRRALMRHDALVEGGVARHGGTIVRPRGEGDSRFAVFPRATDAVAAACAIQQELIAEQWSTSTPLRVRKWGIAGSLVFLGYLSARGADYAKAAALARKSLTLYRELRETVGTQYCLLVLALVAKAEGSLERAARLVAAADDLRLRLIPPVWSLRPFVFDFAGETALVREKLGEEAYGRAWSQGKAMSLAEAIAYALEESGEAQ
jgi:hypothetical protein